MTKSEGRFRHSGLEVDSDFWFRHSDLRSGIGVDAITERVEDEWMTRLHHVERGKGMPVVLVHGFPLDLRVWEAQVEALSDPHRVIAVDMEGFGKSASGAEAFTIDSLAEGI